MPTPRIPKRSAAKKITEAREVLHSFDLPREQQNERSALTLLALLGMMPDLPWSKAEAPLMGITPIMEFAKDYYGKHYAPNTRETVRRQTMHQFVQAGLALYNPDNPKRPVNSPKAVYQVAPSALEVLRAFGLPKWNAKLAEYRTTVVSLRKKYAASRQLNLIPVRLPDGETISLSPGGQNILVKEVIEGFAPRFCPAQAWFSLRPFSLDVNSPSMSTIFHGKRKSGSPKHQTI